MKSISQVCSFFWDWFFWPAWTIWVVASTLTGITGNTFGIVMLGLAVLFWWGMAMFQERIADKYREMTLRKF